MMVINYNYYENIVLNCLALANAIGNILGRFTCAFAPCIPHFFPYELRSLMHKFPDSNIFLHINDNKTPALMFRLVVNDRKRSFGLIVYIRIVSH